jgi:hypothetical protein
MFVFFALNEKKGDFFDFLLLFTLLSTTLLYLPPLRFTVSEDTLCRDRTQDCCDCGNGSQTP